MVSSFNHTPLNTGGLKTLSLFKFSYATNPSLQGKLLWTHLPQRDNLFAVFDYVTCRDPHGQPVRSSLFKVLRGTEVLVCLYIQSDFRIFGTFPSHSLFLPNRRSLILQSLYINHVWMKSDTTLNLFWTQAGLLLLSSRSR